MYHDKSILAVVPARGGSKGIKLKNIREVGGVPMVARVGEIIAQIPSIDRSIVSTDFEDIAEVARNSGLGVPFMRPPELSGDLVSDLEVLTHSLKEMETLDKREYDVVLMLQPTSPLRKAEHVIKTIEKLIIGQFDAVWTVSETDSKSHPLKQLTFQDDFLDYYDGEGVKIIARQQLKPVYHRNGAAYAITRECLLDQKSIKGKKCSAVVIKEPMISIDTEFDIKLAELFIEEYLD